MTRYEVLLEAPNSPQTRLVKLDAEGVAQARAEVERLEAKSVNLSLLPPKKEIWLDPHRHGSNDGLVDMNLWDAYDVEFGQETAKHTSYEEAVRAGKLRLEDWKSRVQIDKSGRIVAHKLGKRSRARLMAHLQTDPYQIVDVKEITKQELDRAKLIREMKAVYEEDRDQWPEMLAALRAAGIHINAVTAFLNGVPWQKQIDGSSVTVFSSASVFMSLHTGLTAVQDTDDFFDDVSASQITGTGYVANGYQFANKTSLYDTATDQDRLDNTVDPNWTTSTLSATDAEVWVNTAGASSTDPVYANIDFGATVTTTAGTFTVALDPTGWAVFDLT